MCYDLYCVLCGVVNWNILDGTELKELNEKLGDKKITEEYFNRLKKSLSYTDDVIIMRKDNINVNGCISDCAFSYYNCKDDNINDKR
jgi:hypothetical protein